MESPQLLKTHVIKYGAEIWTLIVGLVHKFKVAQGTGTQESLRSRRIDECRQLDGKNIEDLLKQEQIPNSMVFLPKGEQIPEYVYILLLYSSSSCPYSLFHFSSTLMSLFYL